MVESQVIEWWPETYIPNPNNLPQVNHKDENKLNNSSNLEWMTNADNKHHSSFCGQY